MVSFMALVDELEKISVELSPGEKAKQTAQFAGLGALTSPALSALTSKIEHGTWLAPGTNKGRWLGARLVRGALVGGALPAIRHHIERRNLETAKARARRA
jgi:hypothetical protein